MEVLLIIFIFVALAAGGAIGYYIHLSSTRKKIGSAEAESHRIIDEARREAERLVKEGELKIKEDQFQARQEFENEVKDRRDELTKLEKRLFSKEENVTKKSDYLDNREQELGKREKKLANREKDWDKKHQDLDELIAGQRQVLEKISGLSAEEAKEQLKESLLNEAKHEAAKKIKAVEEEAKAEAENKSKAIIAQAIQRYAGDYVTERTVSVVGLPNDEMKGRIIGREGRNIRALEAATGIDLIIDDTPEAVVLSGFNPIRREVARMALEKLITDGRIHPSRIEEIVAKCESELDVKIKEFGEQAAFDLGLHGIHPELIKLIGRLYFRTSYGQNVWQHSIEVAFICGIMAGELGLNVKQARRAGLLHDIGKALTHEVEGSHALIGANLARKYGEADKIVNAIAAHHEEEQPEGILAVLMQSADALSGARPGARREILETYVKRLRDLEDLTRSFDGVDKSFAIQAGREIRVIVQSEKVSDDDAIVLAGDIAKKIEQDLTYPGQIKVVVIRETRAVGVAQ